MHAHPTRTLLVALGVFLVLAVVVYTFGVNFISLRQSAPPNSTQGEFSAPAPQDYVSAQKGFQHLVSYTSGGFLPKTLTVKKGETVRFTNNSDSALNLSLAGATPLTRGQYFEYTFTAASPVTDGAGNMTQVTVTAN